MDRCMSTGISRTRSSNEMRESIKHSSPGEYVPPKTICVRTESDVIGRASRSNERMHSVPKDYSDVQPSEYDKDYWY